MGEEICREKKRTMKGKDSLHLGKRSRRFEFAPKERRPPPDGGLWGGEGKPAKIVTAIIKGEGKEERQHDECGEKS